MFVVQPGWQYFHKKFKISSGTYNACYSRAVVARLFHGRDHLADEALRHEENAASRLNFSTVVIIQSSM